MKKTSKTISSDPAMTPMMRQYHSIKNKYPDCLLFYRMGDFYELFLNDAVIGAKVLDITLTSRGKGKEGRIPMAGVPYHAVDPYLARLVKSGYKVAICEQLSEPGKTGIVERDVVRIVTPGTVLDEKALEKKENNFIVSIQIDGSWFGMSVADISTGQITTFQKQSENILKSIIEELGRINPSECILPESLYNQGDILKIFKQEKTLNVSCFQTWTHYSRHASKILFEHFQVKTLSGFGIEQWPLAIETSAALLGYLRETQKNTVKHITTITALLPDEHVQMDRSTSINLELFNTIREHDTHGSLLAVIDTTSTAMGGRLIRQWLRRPLRKHEDIIARLNAVEELIQQNILRKHSVESLKKISDIERTLSRLTVGLGNARDLVNLKYALRETLHIRSILQSTKSPLLKKLSKNISQDIESISTVIETWIVDNPPIQTKEGGIIRSGIHVELDSERNLVEGGKTWIDTLEQQERARTGISSLKVRYNKVFGFYIEISRANMHLAPKEYIRKQTLVGGERFITAELKKQEELILRAEETVKKLEYELFLEVLSTVLSYTTHIQQAAQAVATLDVLISYATCAITYKYTRPKLVYSGEIRIKDGRHPVVERLLDDTPFVPNDVVLNNISQQLLLITGPNMAGKSVYIRQVALIVLLAHIGSFVPAHTAHISLVDRIFVRSGASDVITSGLSTFMVEMVETAYILHHATKHSLIVLDEIGRGTSTYDGISIAWAVAEYLVTQLKVSPKTLFATHYHELQQLENNFPKKIKNYHMAVEQHKDEPIFLHTVRSGAAPHSFGVAVAKLAGIPSSVIERAKHLLQELESGRTEPTKNKSVSISDNNEIYTRLRAIDISKTTPLEALNILAQLSETLHRTQKTNDTI